jgi:hypothetical protein
MKLVVDNEKLMVMDGEKCHGVVYLKELFQYSLRMPGKPIPQVE